jgi:hypothetical protein
MPDRSDKYDGIEDNRPVTVVDKDGAVSVFVIGDWGATLPNHCTFPCEGFDQDAQQKIAAAMKDRAQWAEPQYVLNVGDNFYVEGLQQSCNAPPNDVQEQTVADFDSNWVDMYGDVAKIPWLGVLGNHDYGGWRFDKGWPQQIGYSFINHNWILPARYFTKRIHHPDFYIDYFMFDSNAFDAKDMDGANQDHNICSHHNDGGVGTCANNGGMPDIGQCKQWFWDSHKVQQAWLEDKISESDARWKVIVTHFPCGYETDWYKMLKKDHGLDLVLTGHRHQQELWHTGTSSNYVRAFMETTKWDQHAPQCVVAGGGGGIVSQKFNYADYGVDLAWYGFFHLTIKRDDMYIELIDWDGDSVGNVTIYPHGSDKAARLDSNPVKSKAEGICEDYCGDNNNPWDKVCGWGSDPWMSCVACPGCHKTREKASGDNDEEPEPAPEPKVPDDIETHTFSAKGKPKAATATLGWRDPASGST